MMNVPSRYSLNASLNSASVFITIGPIQAMDSRKGLPGRKRTRNTLVPFAAAAIADAIASPSENRTIVMIPDC